jgi:hypothetical protein
LNTYLPQNHTTPDQGGTLAVSSDTNTGHGSTVTSCSSTDTGPSAPDSDSQAKSCRWFSIPVALLGNVTSAKLKFNWAATGSLDISQDVAGSGTASIQVVIEYSLDGGANWTSQVNKTKSVSGANVSASLDAPTSGSETITLSNSQDTSLVQVRTRTDVFTSATAPSSGTVTSTASITTSISAIQVEIELAQQILVMM